MNRRTWKVLLTLSMLFILSARSTASSSLQLQGRQNFLVASRVPGTVEYVWVSQNWLERFNYYRQVAGLPPVADSSAYSSDLAKHVNYMLLNVPTEGLWHGETPGRPGYTAEGDQAARESNLFWFSNGVSYTTPAIAVDGWMGSIPHRFGMLNPDLQTTGFGLGCDTKNCGAGLNVIGGIVWNSNPRPNGVVYPGPNQKGVKTDIIITWQFHEGPTVVLQSASLKDSNGHSVPITTTTPPSGDYFNVVSVKPQSPLTPDTSYTVSMTVQGSTQLNRSWSFTTNAFTDVPVDHWAWEYIEAFYRAGITTGCSQSPKMFCPNANVTRAEMAVFLERAMSNFNPNPSPSGMFTDVPSNFWAAKFIDEYFNDGITTGCAQGPLRYCPNNNVTRQEMAVFIERALGNFSPSPNPAGNFADVPAPGAPDVFTAFIDQFYNDGITTGCGTNPLRYCPLNNVTRQEMAVFIVRAFQIPMP